MKKKGGKVLRTGKHNGQKDWERAIKKRRRETPQYNYHPQGRKGGCQPQFHQPGKNAGIAAREKLNTTK